MRPALRQWGSLALTFHPHSALELADASERRKYRMSSFSLTTAYIEGYESYHDMRA